MKRPGRKKVKLVNPSRRTENQPEVSSIFLQCSSVGASKNQRTLELILQLESKDGRSIEEVLSDFVNGMILCTDVCAESVCIDKGGNCERCGEKCEQRETVVRFTVKAGRTICPCINTDYSRSIDGITDCLTEADSNIFDQPLVQDGDVSGNFLCGSEPVYEVDDLFNKPTDDHGQILNDVTDGLSEKYSCDPVSVDTDQPTSLTSLSVQLDSTEDHPLQEVPEEKENDNIQNHTSLDQTNISLNNEFPTPVEEAVTGDDQCCQSCGPNTKCRCSFVCEICNIECADLKDLKMHLKLHQSEEGTVCTLCDATFKRKLDLKKHLNTVHADERAYKCDVCQKSFRDIYALKLHSRVHSGIRPYQCDICGRTYTNSSGLRSHGRCHTTVKKFKCDLCDKAFYLSTELKSHKAVHTGERPFPCTLCDLSFRTKHHLNKHIKIHGERKHQCKVCSKAFITAKDLETHTTTHTGDKKFKCKVCGSTFTVKASLKNHLLLHLQIRPYKCNICQKDYPSEVQLRKHSRLHNTDNPFVCEWCGKSFAINHYLQSHRKTHTGYQKLRCHICNKTYRDAAYLKIHMKTHTGEGLSKCEMCGEDFADPTYLNVHKKKYCKAKKVSCEDCGREFINSRELSFHVGVHTGKRPHECTVCGKGFAKADALQTHARRHDESQKVHECDICCKRFVCQSDLRKHQRCHTSKKVKNDMPNEFKYQLQIVNNSLIPTESSIDGTFVTLPSEIPQSDISIEAPINTAPGTLLVENPTQGLDLSDIPVISLPPDDQPETCYLPDKHNGLVKSESSEMLLDTASISSPIHLDTLDPNTSLENALSFVMSDPDQLLSNPYVMYRLILPGKSPNK